MRSSICVILGWGQEGYPNVIFHGGLPCWTMTYLHVFGIRHVLTYAQLFTGQPVSAIFGTVQYSKGVLCTPSYGDLSLGC